MFVYYYVYLERPFADVERALFELLDRLESWARHAYDHGETLRARISVGAPVLAKTVRVETAQPVRGDKQSTLPLTWEATGTPGLFPRADADLVLAALGSDVTQIAFRGTYRPPLGVIGRALDRTLLHHLAEASVKQLLEDVADAVEKHLDASVTAAE